MPDGDVRQLWQTHPLAPVTPHRTHPLTLSGIHFAPSRLNSHFTSSRNTPVHSGTVGNEGFLPPQSAKYEQWKWLGNAVYPIFDRLHLRRVIPRGAYWQKKNNWPIDFLSVSQR